MASWWIEAVLDSIKNYQVQTRQMINFQVQAHNAIIKNYPAVKERKISEQVVYSSLNENFPEARELLRQPSTKDGIGTTMKLTSLECVKTTQLFHSDETSRRDLQDGLCETLPESRGFVHAYPGSVSGRAILPDLPLVQSYPESAHKKVLDSAVEAGGSVGTDQKRTEIEDLRDHVIPRASIGEEFSVKGKSLGSPSFRAPPGGRITRSRAKALQNADVSQVKALNDPGVRKRRAQRKNIQAVVETTSRAQELQDSGIHGVEKSVASREPNLGCDLNGERMFKPDIGHADCLDNGFKISKVCRESSNTRKPTVEQVNSFAPLNVNTTRKCEDQQARLDATRFDGGRCFGGNVASTVACDTNYNQIKSGPQNGPVEFEANNFLGEAESCGRESFQLACLGHRDKAITDVIPFELRSIDKHDRDLQQKGELIGSRAFVMDTYRSPELTKKVDGDKIPEGVEGRKLNLDVDGCKVWSPSRANIVESSILQLTQEVEEVDADSFNMEDAKLESKRVEDDGNRCIDLNWERWEELRTSVKVQTKTSLCPQRVDVPDPSSILKASPLKGLSSGGSGSRTGRKSLNVYIGTCQDVQADIVGQVAPTQFSSKSDVLRCFDIPLRPEDINTAANGTNLHHLCSPLKICSQSKDTPQDGRMNLNVSHPRQVDGGTCSGDTVVLTDDDEQDNSDTTPSTLARDYANMPRSVDSGPQKLATVTPLDVRKSLRKSGSSRMDVQIQETFGGSENHGYLTSGSIRRGNFFTQSSALKEDDEMIVDSTPTSKGERFGLSKYSTVKVDRSISNIINPFSKWNLCLSSKTFVPANTQGNPTFIPSGKRNVRVKALEAADAARRVQEKREFEKRERMQKLRGIRAIEKDKEG